MDDIIQNARRDFPIISLTSGANMFHPPSAGSAGMQDPNLVIIMPADALACNSTKPSTSTAIVRNDARCSGFHWFQIKFQWLDDMWEIYNKTLLNFQ